MNMLKSVVCKLVERVHMSGERDFLGLALTVTP
jgi:hypothetical protein